MNQIAIYEDEGVSRECLEHAKLFFPGSFFVNSQKIDYLVSNPPKAFIMPGGRDLLYAKKLNGENNQIIKKYVENGGIYIGICAGAYYGASFIEFDFRGKKEIIGKRELAFFKGKAIGPLFDYYYESNKGARVLEIKFEERPVNLFYNGGCYFEAEKNSEQNFKIIGTYEDKKIAILEIKYGAGRVILSGVHFEYSYKIMQNYGHEEDMIFKIKNSNHNGIDFFKNIKSL